MKSTYDSHHRATTQPVLKSGDTVFIKDRQATGVVEKSSPQSERSIIVQTPQGYFRRNRRMLVKVPDAPELPGPEPTSVVASEATDHAPSNTPQPDTPERHPEGITRSGRKVKPPDKLNL